MNDYLKFLIAPLLSEPEQLAITTHQSTISVKVAKNDMGRVIGKGGTNITSLRNLVRTYCTLHQLGPVSLTLEEQ